MSPVDSASRAAVVATIAALLVVALATGERLDDDFRRFLGPLPPAAGLAIAVAAGWAALAVLDRRGWIREVGLPEARWVVAIAIGAVLFTAAAIVADLSIGFDEDTNVGWPGSLAFYVVIAVVAEVVFHLVPLALAALIVSNRGSELTGRVALTLVAVGALEAAFQLVLSRADGDAALLSGFVAVHVLAIGLFQMMLFWRAGPSAMLLFRPAYYALWHVAWGALRLRVRF